MHLFSTLSQIIKAVVRYLYEDGTYDHGRKY